MTVTLAAERPTVAAPAPAQQQAGALAIRADQTMWSPQQEAVLRQSGISDSVTKPELAGFLHLCQRTGLDPFSRQIYLIGRYDRRAGREVFTPQTGIDGYRVVARRATAKTGGTYGYEDTLWCDESGRWRDVWLSADPPAAAKVTVIRDGQRFSAVARYSEYVQTGKEDKPVGLWRKMPASQLAKCCEALALRRAFPHDLAGVYTAEEMAQADNAEQAPAMRRQQPQAADQWQQATPARPAEPGPAEVAPTGVAAAAEQDAATTPAGRDYLAEAYAAGDQPTVRSIYDDARAEGAVPEYLAQIAKVGVTKPPAAPAAPEEAGPAPYSMADAEAAAGAFLDEPLPGAPASQADRLDAITALYAAGTAAGLSQVETRNVLAKETRKSIGDATVDDITRVAADLRAAGGAR